MSATIGYTRVSTSDQHTENHKTQVEERYRVDDWYTDEAVSGSVRALDRPGFSKLHEYVRDGDTVVVPAIDRLGRDTVDVLTTVEALQAKGVTVISHREGFDLGTSIGKAMLTMLSAVGELEWNNIKERQKAGIERAKTEGRTGRPKSVDLKEVAQWRKDNEASIKKTAEVFGVGVSTVKRACQQYQAKVTA